jgi:hypothetical protein
MSVKAKRRFDNPTQRNTASLAAQRLANCSVVCVLLLQSLISRAGVIAGQEYLGVPLDQAADPVTLNQMRADANDVHRCRFASTE